MPSTRSGMRADVIIIVVVACFPFLSHARRALTQVRNTNLKAVHASITALNTPPLSQSAGLPRLPSSPLTQSAIFSGSLSDNFGLHQVARGAQKSLVDGKIERSLRPVEQARIGSGSSRQATTRTPALLDVTSGSRLGRLRNGLVRRVRSVKSRWPAFWRRLARPSSVRKIAAGAIAPVGLVEGARPIVTVIGDLVSHVSAYEWDSLLLLFVSAIVPPIMRRLRLSSVLGFLFAGMILGPTGLALVSDIKTTTKLAELGVVFFLFEMGLELELERLKAVGSDAFRLGTFQMAVTSVAIGCIALSLGASAPASIVVGGGLALSSSVFVIQQLTERGELATRFGRAAFGILLLQDLAVVPLLVVTPLLSSTGAALGAALRSALLKSVSALAIIFVAGQFVLNRAFRLVASAKDRTSFLSITLLTVVSMSTFTQVLGLSDTLGAFLAGVLLAETKYRYQVTADIAPFRGLLLGLFFITTGFSVDLSVAMTSAPLILGLAVGLHVIKTAITTLVCVVAGLKRPIALRTGLVLSQGGEFFFVLLALAQTHNILVPKEVKILLTTVVITMFLTPFLNLLGARITQLAGQTLHSSRKNLSSTDDDKQSSGYVLVCGYGFVGSIVCGLLTQKLIRYKAFDTDVRRVAAAREKDLPVFLGDATRPDMVRKMLGGEGRLIKAIVITIDGERNSSKAVSVLRRMLPRFASEDLPIFVRAANKRHHKELSSAGATSLVIGPWYSSLMLGGAVLSKLGTEQEEVAQIIEQERLDLKDQFNTMLFGDDGQEDEDEREEGQESDVEKKKDGQH